MKNRHGPKGGRGSSIYRSSRRGDERVIRTGAEIADFDGVNSDDDQNDEDDDDGETKRADSHSDDIFSALQSVK